MAHPRTQQAAAARAGRLLAGWRTPGRPAVGQRTWRALSIVAVAVTVAVAGASADGPADPGGAAPDVSGEQVVPPQAATSRDRAVVIGGTAGIGAGDSPDGAVAAGTVTPASSAVPGAVAAAGPAGIGDPASPVAGQVAPAPPTDTDVSAPDPPASGPVEQRVSGTLVQLWAESEATDGDHEDGDHAGAHAAARETWLETPGQRLHLATGPTDSLASGSAVSLRVTGPAPDNRFHVVSLEAVAAPAPAVVDGIELGSGKTLDYGALPAASVHEVTAVLAVPAGAAPDGTSLDAFRATINGPVAEFWSSQTGGGRTIAVTAAHSWVQLASSCRADPMALWSEVAQKVGWVAGPRKHLIVYLPTAAGCGAGLGTVGPNPESGGRVWVSHTSTDVIAHEFGHNLGLGHSNGLLCPAGSDGNFAAGTWSSGCAVEGYRDWYDVMGISWGNVGTLSAAHADRLGVLSSTAKVTVTAPMTVRLGPSSGDGLRVARIDDPAGTYYVEYRTASGRDSWLTGNWRGLTPGVVVRRVSPVDAREALLLDGTVTAGTRTDDWSSSLSPGQRLDTASGRTRVSVTSADQAGATIAIAIDGVAPPPGQPLTTGQAVRITPPTGAVPAGQVVLDGTASAPEGTLRWQVRQGSTPKAEGIAAAGANGTVGPFTIAVSLPAGSYTVRAWVPDDSGGEGNVAALSDQVALTVQ